MADPEKESDGIQNNRSSQRFSDNQRSLVILARVRVIFGLFSAKEGSGFAEILSFLLSFDKIIQGFSTYFSKYF